MPHERDPLDRPDHEAGFDQTLEAIHRLAEEQLPATSLPWNNPDAQLDDVGKERLAEVGGQWEEAEREEAMAMAQVESLWKRFPDSQQSIEAYLRNPENTKTVDTISALMQDIGEEYSEKLKMGSADSLRLLDAFIKARRLRTLFMQSLFATLEQRLEKG